MTGFVAHYKQLPPDRLLSLYVEGGLSEEAYRALLAELSARGLQLPVLSSEPHPFSPTRGRPGKGAKNENRQSRLPRFLPASVVTFAAVHLGYVVFASAIAPLLSRGRSILFFLGEAFVLAFLVAIPVAVFLLWLEQGSTPGRSEHLHHCGLLYVVLALGCAGLAVSLGDLDAVAVGVSAFVSALELGAIVGNAATLAFSRRSISAQ